MAKATKKKARNYSTRKNIDLGPELKTNLAILAAKAGKDLKTFIEDALAELAEKSKKNKSAP